MKSFIAAVLLLQLSLLPLLVTAAATSDETITVDGRARRFLVHDFAGSTPAPMVILLHGGGGSGDNMARQTGFDTVAAREGLIAVYPYGSSRLFANALLTWNAGHCCAYAMREDIDDVRFISQLIDHLIAGGRVDPARVYVTGLSNGGMMTHRLGRELPQKIAAIAPVIASNFGDEPLRQFAMPTLIINGADDQVVRAEGGELGLSLLSGLISGETTADRPTLPVSSQRDYWAAVNGCTGPGEETTATHVLHAYAGCRVGGAVQHYIVTGNGHAWPGGTAPRDDADQPVQTVSANELIWAFFKQFKREAAGADAANAFYYDEQLTVPVFVAGTSSYSARMKLVSMVPLEFEVQQLQSAGAATVNAANHYQSGTLTLDPVIVGSERRKAALTVSNVSPLRLRLLP